MEIGNCTFHVMDERVMYFHKNLRALIDSVTEEEKEGLALFCKKISGNLGRNVELTWGYDLPDGRIENVLAHICPSSRQCLHLAEASGIENGYLRYQGHNLTNDIVRTPAYAVVVMYIALLNGHAVKHLP